MMNAEKCGRNHIPLMPLLPAHCSPLSHCWPAECNENIGTAAKCSKLQQYSYSNRLKLTMLAIKPQCQCLKRRQHMDDAQSDKQRWRRRIWQFLGLDYAPLTDSFNENKNTENTIISCSEKNLSLFSARVATPWDNKNNTGGFTDSLCLSASSFQWALGPVSIQTISQKGNTYSRIFYTPN